MKTPPDLRIPAAAAGVLLAAGGLGWAAGAGHLHLGVPRAAVSALEALPWIGPPELANELADATSPYLRSAAAQPVAWQEWGPESFRLARELDRPIWLDIGAIWCHWCHVMDRETYENSELARLINEDFIPVKVDRDERPDIDTRYQLAHQAITGRPGGWPLTMFLAPDGTPFSGGTYFPPESRGGRPGVRDIAPRIATAYHEQRGQVEDVTATLRRQLAAVATRSGSADALDPGLPAALAGDVGAAFDTAYGGFGAAPGTKFPNAEAIRLALARGHLDGDPELVERSFATLRAYAASGLRDHVLGGFFRYSTNRELTVPHFEKMDYVQAALMQAYLDAYLLTGDEAFAEVARDVMRYVDRTLSNRAEGGFYPHQDADVSLDDDGSYFTWSLERLEATVAPEEADVLRLHFGVEADGEMREHPEQNVLRVVKDPREVAGALGIEEAEVRRRIASGVAKMRAARLALEPPIVEETRYTSRNAMMVVAYLDAWEALGDEAARDFALRSLDLVLDRNVDEDGTAHHVFHEGRAPVDGTLEDYAFLADALADAYQVTGRERYLTRAQDVMERAVELLEDPGGGFFDRAPDPDALGLLAAPKKDFIDAPRPGPNAVAARAAAKLYLLTSEDRWRALAERTLVAFAGEAAGRGTFVGTYALALGSHLDKPAQTVVIGPADEPLTGRLARAAWETYRPGRLVAIYDPTTVALDALPPAVAGAALAFRGDPAPRAYVCVGETCAPPTSEPAEVARLVRDYGRTGPR